MSHDRSLAEPAFPGDDGRVDPDLASVVDDPVETLGRLGAARVFVPIVALAGDVPTDGDKDAEMAAVLLTGADGRTALLAFRSVATMAAWNTGARPVPVYGQAAARSAIAEGASAMVLDLGSRGSLVVETDDLEHIAAGDRLVRTDRGTAWVRATSPTDEGAP
ncbi:hypothetical protein HMPREF0063_10629 [Aeromicrobium marinum DSM 15272]|uniref:SseB protein N-terminal domain-containing protein n=1 Tax=Aeromicrobium marinum DSM 15272 TaxID=585531 RepID=E2S9I9_9ACTN|nr:SseB family protein [Aeromicrobium marinum]EFQ83913.1 hypothetical protein HMPREF0063_10629 [Aeromicrobium marinum DSM 15272]